MADADQPLIRAEDRITSSPNGDVSLGLGDVRAAGYISPRGGQHGSVAQGGGRMQAANSQAEPSRVELTGGHMPYQAADRALPAAPSSASSSASVSGGSGVRMGRRRSSSSMVGEGAGAVGGAVGGGGGRSLLAGLLAPLGDDRSFVALDMSDASGGDGGGGSHLVRRGSSSVWGPGMVPEDVLVHSFSFLTPAELAVVSSVSRNWSHASYEPSLWTHMDLSGLFLRVDDAFVTHLLGSRRFVHLKFLSLEGCSAITFKTLRALMHYCPNLVELRLTDCTAAGAKNPWIFVELVRQLRFLRRLELWGVTKEYGIVTPMMQAQPRLDLGLFWMEYCAENGIRIDGKGLADCRYQEGGAFDADGDGENDPRVPAPAPQRAGAAAAAAAGAAGGAGGVGGAGGRGCWGRVKGRLVYASNFYHRGGNYPRQVLYSCENHSQQDFADENFHRCQVCENLFAAPFRHSMWTSMICKVCFDQENLHNKKNWIPLDVPSIRSFGWTELMNKTVHVASRKNLPISLRSFGATRVRLDYTLPEPVQAEVDEEAEAEAGGEEAQALIPRIGRVGLGGGLLGDPAVRGAGAAAAASSAVVPPSRRRPPPRIDPTEVPLPLFMASNGWRVDEAIHRVKGHLITAAEGLNTRALLVYDGERNVEVLADKRVILDGREGEEHMDLTVQAWAVTLEILYPVLIVMILALHFSVLFFKQTLYTYSGRTDYMAYIAEPPASGMGALLVIVIALAVIVSIVIGAVLVYRFREQCERCFKRFLVADIGLILMFGIATMMWLLCTQWRIYLDGLTFGLLIWNGALTGLMTLYYPMPERLHHFCLVLLNAIMAILLVATLPVWVIVAFLFVAALADVASELRPNSRLLSPFIIPANVELIYSTPKILYTVGGLRLRAADLLWYGLLTTLVVYTGDSVSSYASSLLGGTLIVVCVLASLAILLFVAPFLGSRLRPLPLAVLSAFVLSMIQGPVIEPFLLAQNDIFDDNIVTF